MKYVLVFNPVIGKYFGDKGLSITQANSIKNDNTNKAAKYLTPFESPVFNVETKVINTSLTTDVTKVVKITPDDFAKLWTVAELYAENAVVGQALQLFKETQKLIEEIDVDEVVKLFGLEVPTPNLKPPIPKRVVKTSTDHFMELDSIEELVKYLCLDTLNKIDADLIKTALKNESTAAVLGKQLTKKESWLKRLFSTPKEQLSAQRETNFGLVLSKNVLAYDDNELEQFELLQQELYTAYTKIQSQVNGAKKIIKDTVRNDLAEAQKIYNEEMAQYNKLANEYSAKLSEARNKAELIRQEALKELSNLKIIA